MKINFLIESLKTANKTLFSAKNRNKNNVSIIGSV
jgi:hypothetical protein